MPAHLHGCVPPRSPVGCVDRTQFASRLVQHLGHSCERSNGDVGSVRQIKLLKVLAARNYMYYSKNGEDPGIMISEPIVLLPMHTCSSTGMIE